MHLWLLLSVVAMFFWGITGVTQKLSTNHISFERSFLWFAAAFFLLAAGIMAAVPLSWNVPAALVVLAALGGLLNGLGALTSFAALERGGKASVVIPIISLYPLLTIAGAWMFLGESLTGRQIAGVICALGAVVLLSQEGPPPKG
ncbi:MAG TPA: DMT family transporter [Bryobacteraceae bacterium]|nr:DMT family transporter [Bryobacteraceae bacterium]